MWQVNHYHFHIVLEVTLGNTEMIQGIEAQINSHNLTQNIITVIVILNHRVEVVHHTQDHQPHKIVLIIALEHNHLTIIEECNTLTEEYILFTSCKSNIWLLPLTIYIQQTPDHTKTIWPPHLEIDFLFDSGASLNVLNNDTWNEIKEYHS